MYDLKFYHLNLNIERNSLFISGNVKSIAKVIVSSLDSFAFVLHENHTIDSVYVNGIKCNFVRRDSLVNTGLAASIFQNQLFEAIVYYQGTCPSGASPDIGNGYNIGISSTWGNESSASLSESFVAYEWFPCKQDLRDKIDSSWVFATTDSANMVGSNGLLKNIFSIGNKRRFEWKSNYPIAYYLISVSTAKYKPYNLYAKPLYLNGDSILIQNFIFDSALKSPSWNSQKAELNKIIQTMELECQLFGMYPFYKEKYGHCMASITGGMEHQTMTTIDLFSFYGCAHELAHQWWGNNVTCASWKDIFMNEGWATYGEYLCGQYLQSISGPSVLNMNIIHNTVLSLPGGSSYINNADTMNAGVIFDGRLTYYKGAAIIHMLRYEINNDSIFFNAIRSFQYIYKGSTASVIDFKNFMETYTNLNLTQFFNQWYYGEGYPTFDVKWNQVGGSLFIKSVQTQSMPGSVPLFITPIDYRIVRVGYPDTVLRLTQTQLTQNFIIPMSGNTLLMSLDQQNWILNKSIGPSKDITLSITGMEEQTSALIFVGPNPASDLLNIYLYKNDQVLVEIIDVTGKIVMSQTINLQVTFDVSKYANGIYTVTIKNKQEEVLKTTKVVKN